jgi:hypothetical protein
MRNLYDTHRAEGDNVQLAANTGFAVRLWLGIDKLRYKMDGSERECVVLGVGAL